MFKKPVVPLKRKEVPVCSFDVIHFKRCLNPDCGRPFKLSRFIGHSSGMTDIGKLICPHCGAQFAAQPDSIYVSQAMAPNEESDFMLWRAGENAEGR